jgi:hypothetical protein
LLILLGNVFFKIIIGQRFQYERSEAGFCSLFVAIFVFLLAGFPHCACVPLFCSLRLVRPQRVFATPFYVFYLEPSELYLLTICVVHLFYRVHLRTFSLHSIFVSIVFLIIFYSFLHSYNIFQNLYVDFTGVVSVLMSVI